MNWFVSLWHNIKRLFGITVIDNFKDLMECMTYYPTKSRCDI